MQENMSSQGGLQRDLADCTAGECCIGVQPKGSPAAPPFAKTTKYAKLGALGSVLTATNPPDYTKGRTN